MSKALAKQTGTGEKPVHYQTLGDIVNTLIEINEVLEDTPEEQKPAVEAELMRVIGTELASKVDGLALFVKRCEAEAEIVKALAEEAREKARQWEARKVRTRNLVKWAFLKLGIKKAKGNLHSISISDGREKLHVYDEAQIPARFKVASVSMPLMLWRAVVSALPFQVANAIGNGAEISISVDNGAVTAALKAEENVPGAGLVTGEDILTIR